MQTSVVVYPSNYYTCERVQDIAIKGKLHEQRNTKNKEV